MTETNEIKRGPGRPKGLGKVPGSGRKPGTPNRDRAATVEKIMSLADPLEFLCKVARGDRMSAAAKPGTSEKTWWVPTGDQRISAAQTLARKVLPDLKATELTGGLEPVITSITRIIIDPKKPPEAQVKSLGENGVDNDRSYTDLAPRNAVDLMTQRRQR